VEFENIKNYKALANSIDFMLMLDGCLDFKDGFLNASA
jgi:hypothetical protein